MRQNWKRQARALKADTYALYLAYRHPRTPRKARIFAVLVVAYAFSPIDLIPDPIPVLGYLDDLLLVPLGIYLALKMIPPDIMDECRQRAKDEVGSDKPVFRGAAAVIVLIWLLFAGLITALLYRWFAN